VVFTKCETLSQFPYLRPALSSLFFRQVANHGQLEHLALVGFQQQNNPNHKSSQADQQVQRSSNENQEGHDGHNRKRDLKGSYRHAEENTLEGVKANKPVLVIRSGHQKDDRRDKGYVRQHSGHVVRHARGSNGGRDRGPSTTRRAGSRAVGNLRTTGINDVIKIGRRGLVIGTAQSNFDSADLKKQTVKDKSGKQQTVRIGAVEDQVDKVYYQAPDDKSSFLPVAWQDFANNVAGHQVSPIRVMLAAILGIVLFGVIAVLMYSAVRAAIISIGRNPLSEPAVHKSLFQVGVSVLGVLVFAAIVIYLILTT